MVTNAQRIERVWTMVRTVHDPELPYLTVEEMGMVRGVTMRDNQPDEYAEFIAANMRAWDDPLPEPIYQLVDSAGYFLIRSVQKALGEEQTSSNFVVTEKLATKFRDASLKLYGTQIQVDKLLVEAKK